MTDKLILTICGNNQERQVLLSGDCYEIGRDGKCGICLVDTEVSRHHARIRIERNGSGEAARIFLEDLNSLNGTFVNGHSIQRYQLQVGDQIQTGGTCLKLESLTSFEYRMGISLEQKAFQVKKYSGNAGDLSLETLKNDSNFGLSQNSSSLLEDDSASRRFLGGEHFPVSGVGLDSVDVTMSTPDDQDRILRTISHKEGEKFLSSQHTEKLRSEGKWTSRAQGFLHLLYEMTRSISRCTDIERLTQELLELIFKWVDADRGCILLFDSNSNRLIPSAKKVRKEFESQRMIISKTILDYVLEHREGVLTTNARNDKRWDEAASVLSVGIHEAICVPLQGRYGIVGAIYLDTFSRSDGVTQEIHRFGEEYLKLMITIAHHIAIAVEDTRYYQGMLQAERLAAIGQTVATLSHHIKNILQGIQGGSYLIQSGLEEHNENFIAKGWKIVERNQNRISVLILDMLTFSKERKPELAPGSLNRVVEEVVELMRDRAVRSNVLLTWNPDESVPESLFDSEAINHAVLNLVTNAIDAVVEQMESEKQKICDSVQTICYGEHDSYSGEKDSPETESIFADGSHIFEDEEEHEIEGVSSDPESENSGCAAMPVGQVDVLTQYDAVKNVIRIYVKDTGVGLTKEQVANIFRPFESSKGNRGTGLGLPVCRKIVREHGGTIHVEPRTPHGCRFVITLPVIHDV